MVEIQGRTRPRTVEVDGDNVVVHDGHCSCGFVTSLWPSKDLAEERLIQHATEHAVGEPMELLSEFRARHGLGTADDGRATLPDDGEDVDLSEVWSLANDPDADVENAITATDILYKLSINTGPGNSTAQGDPNDSIGGFMSSTQITDATLHNLFDQISGAENQAADVEYRCFFVHNNHGTLTWQSVVAWLASEVSGGADAAIALDGTGVVSATSASAQAERVADESTAPSGETFSAPTTKGTGLAIGDIAAGSVQAIWVRRTATNSAALSNDGVTVRCEGDTAA